MNVRVMCQDHCAVCPCRCHEAVRLQPMASAETGLTSSPRQHGLIGLFTHLFTKRCAAFWFLRNSAVVDDGWECLLDRCSQQVLGCVTCKQVLFQICYQTHLEDRRDEKYEATSFRRILLTVWVIQRLSRRTPAFALGGACNGPSLVGLLVSSLLPALGESKPQAEKARRSVPVS
jgi:hypothetical protein